MRICIVTPGQLGSNPRVVKEASALTAAGHEVTVICTRVAAFVEPRDQAIMREARFKIQRLAFDRPVPWHLARLQQELARWTFHIAQVPAMAHRAISAMTPALTRAALQHAADLYIAHYPPALPAAAAAAGRHGARYAFDAEDFHLGDLPDLAEHAREKQLLRAVEGRYLPDAAYVTAASPLIAQAYAEVYRIAPPTVLLNLFPRASAPEVPTVAGGATPGPSLYWFSQVVGPGRGLEDAVQALALTRSRVHLYLRGTPAHGYVEDLKTLAASVGVAQRVHVLPPIEPDILEREGSRFDIGYVGDQAQTRNRQIALSNKLFSYLTSGVPVVATDIAAHQQLIGQLGMAGLLVPLRKPEALARALDSLLSDPASLAHRRRHAWELGQTTFSWESQIERLTGLVSRTREERQAVA